MEGQTRSSFSLDWRWVVAAYAYLVLFHMLPTYLLSGLATITFFNSPASSGWGFKEADVATLWLLAGIAVVAFVVGLRSKGFTILEPAVAGVLYAITTTLGFRTFATANVRGRVVLVAVFWLLIVVILSVASAWIGEAVQRRNVGRRQIRQP